MAYFIYRRGPVALIEIFGQTSVRAHDPQISRVVKPRALHGATAVLVGRWRHKCSYLTIEQVYAVASLMQLENTARVSVSKCHRHWCAVKARIVLRVSISSGEVVQKLV